MTSVLDTEVLARKLNESIPDVVEGHGDGDLWIKAESIADVCAQLKNDPETSMDYLVSVSAVDYIEYFEMVYHLRSISLNHGVVLKSKCWGREDIEVPSVTHLWQGADFQEREIFDMYGVTAAHKEFPFNTITRVTNENNGKSHIIRINDRGPYVGDRILDCSFGAAKKLGFVSEGTTPVKIEILEWGDGEYMHHD